MSSSAPKSIFTRLLIAFMMAASSWAFAHAPFGSSTVLAIGTDELHVDVTMGWKGSEGVLLSGGRTNEAAMAHALGATNMVQELPPSFAARLITLSFSNSVLEARRVTLKSDGTDSFFALTFPRPKAEALVAEATYFKHVEAMGPGTLVVQSPAGEEIAAALLTREHCRAQVPLDSGEARAPAGPGTKPRPGFGEFFRLGVWHILIGFDHLLFLGALLVGVRRVGSMVAVITCFTLAHSVTLALAVMDLVNFSSRLIEPLIAASIIVVGVENLILREAQTDRYFMAGGFGLIHGFGFAGVLRETGLGRAGSEIVVPLFSFNLGVEAGQLAVAAIVVPLLLWARQSPKFTRFGTQSISCVVIAVSAYWLLERLR